MKNYTWMFTAALFVRAKNCKQMSFNGWMVKQMVVHMYYELLFAPPPKGMSNNLGKNANLWRLCTEWFYLYSFPEMTNYRNGE